MIVRARIRPGGLAWVMFATAPRELPAPGDTEIFAAIAQPQTRRLVPWLCSLALHAIGICATIFLFDNVISTDEGPVPRYSARFIRFQPSAASHLPAPGPGARNRPVDTIRGPAAEVDPVAGAAVETLREAPVPRRFVLPDLPVRARSAQVLLQPEFPANLPVRSDIRLPEMLLWKTAPAPAPQPRKLFVAEKHPNVLPQPKRLPAPPALAAPNQEHQVTEWASTGLFVNPSPVLPRAPGTTAPIQTRGAGDSGPAPQIAPASSVEAKPPLLVSIPEIPVPPAGVFQLPAGNQAESASARDAGSPGSSTVKGGLGRGIAREAPGNENVRVSQGPGSPGHGSGAGDSGSARGEGERGPAAGHPVAKVVLPPDGHFPVLVESSSSEAFPETEGVLTGRLIYTAYVRAGARKDWILQYCLPHGVEQTLSVSARRAPLEAPYPYLMLRPELSAASDSDYLILHGIVTVFGKFDQLTYIIAPEEQSEKDQLLHSLAQWQVRPGKLDGQPISLEILLIIPRDRE
jgi:hypothetical protein